MYGALTTPRSIHVVPPSILVMRCNVPAKLSSAAIYLPFHVVRQLRLVTTPGTPLIIGVIFTGVPLTTQYKVFPEPSGEVSPYINCGELPEFSAVRLLRIYQGTSI